MKRIRYLVAASLDGYIAALGGWAIGGISPLRAATQGRPYDPR